MTTARTIYTSHGVASALDILADDDNARVRIKTHASRMVGKCLIAISEDGDALADKDDASDDLLDRATAKLAADSQKTEGAWGGAVEWNAYIRDLTAWIESASDGITHAAVHAGIWYAAREDGTW